MHQQLIIGGDATVEVFYMAICQNCTPVLPIPFAEKTERAVWVAAHIAGTDHTVQCIIDIRITTTEGG